MQISLAPSVAKKGALPKEKQPPKSIVTFGSVTTESSALGKEEEARNIKAGQSALARAKTLIVTPGVTIKVGRNVPLFHADPDRPDELVRVWRGKRERGVFVNGRFKIVR